MTLLRRRHVADGCRSDAVFSPCQSYRYALTRCWGDGPRITWVMLNPSTADERRNDPTIERCERRSRAMGFGAMRIVNLFAWRATDPADLKRAAAPEGPANRRAVLTAARWADIVVAAWGVHGTHRGAHLAAEDLLRRNRAVPHVLGLTRDGHPRHPLYVGYDVTPIPWEAP